MLLHFCALGVTMSWDEGFLGARASRPHKAGHSLGHLPHLDQPGTAPWLSFGLAAAVPAHRVAACSIALKLSGGQRDSMRAGRPRSRVIRNRMRAGRPRSRVTSQKAHVHPLGISRLPVSPGPALSCGSFQEKRRSLMTNHEWTRINTNRPEDRWTSFNVKRHQNAAPAVRSRPGAQLTGNGATYCSIALKLSGGCQGTAPAFWMRRRSAAAPGKGRRPLRAPVRPGRVLPGDRLSGRTA